MKDKEPPKNKINYIYPLILLASCLIVYSNSMKKGFSTFDDPKEVFFNTSLTDTTMQGAVKLFTKPKVFGFYAPVRSLAHLLNYSLTGSFNPAAFHAVNILLHILTVFSCFIFLKLLTKNQRYSFLVSLLFAIHPCHDHPINGIAARGLLLAGLFSFLTLIFYMLSERQRAAERREETIPGGKIASWTHYALSILFFLLGILSHPTIIMLPVIIIIYRVLLVEDNNTVYGRLQTAVIKALPFFLIIIFYLALSRFYFRSNSAQVGLDKISPSIANAVKIDTDLLATYFINGFCTLNRNYYDMAVLSPFEKAAIFAAMLVFFRAGLWKLKRRPWRILAPAIFFITLLPSFFMIYRNSAINLRYMYFASTGIFMLIFAVIEPYISDNPENKSSKPLVYGLIIAAIVFLANISYNNNKRPIGVADDADPSRKQYYLKNVEGQTFLFEKTNQ